MVECQLVKARIHKQLSHSREEKPWGIGVLMFEKFMDNGGQLRIDQEAVTVRLKKKRHLPLLLTALERYIIFSNSSLKILPSLL